MAIDLPRNITINISRMSPSQPPSTKRRFITVTEDDDLDLDALLIDDSFSTSRENPPPAPVASFSPRSAVPISAIEEDTAEGHWVLPTPAQPGDFLTSTIHRVPSKSILKKTSSYGNFDLNESISSSKRAPSSGNMKKKSSYLSFGDHMNNSMNSGVGSAGSSGKFGLDLDSSSQSQISTPYTLGIAHHRNSMSNFQIVAATETDTSPLVADKASKSGADAAAGTLETSIGSSSKALSASGSKMKRNVSFHAVDVRQYDLTVGDNPSCRSGPPLSLDWSYSKSTSKKLDEYELERSSERVSHVSKLHVNKYQRRNMLAFHWGHTEAEMKEARKETKKMQRQRSVTKALLPVHLAHEVCLSIKNLVSKKNSHRDGLSGDEMSELSLSSSKHVDSLSGSRHSVGSSRHGSPPRPAKVHASEMQGVPLNVSEVDRFDFVEDA